MPDTDPIQNQTPGQVLAGVPAQAPPPGQAPSLAGQPPAPAQQAPTPQRASVISPKDLFPMTMTPKPGSVALQFKRVCPDYVPSQNNYRVVVSTLAFNALSAAQRQSSIDEQVADMIDLGVWTVPNLVAVYNALTAEGLLDVTDRGVRGSYPAKARRKDEAVGKYLRAVVDASVLTVLEKFHLDGVHARRAFLARQ